MHPVQVLAENVAVEEELFAEVTPWVRQNLSATVTRGVSMFDMVTQLLHVVNPLLANEDSATFEADKTKGLLMCGLHVATQTLLIRELLFVFAVGHETGQCSQFHTLDLRLPICVVDRVIGPVRVTFMPDIVVKFIPG